MKTKNLDKKLSLSKQTVADLELKSAKGGVFFPTFTILACTYDSICITIEKSCFSCVPYACPPETN